MTNIFMKDYDIRSMNTLICINKILEIYDKSLDDECINLKKLNPAALKMSEVKFGKLMVMLYKSGYIDGFVFDDTIDGKTSFDYSNSSITFEGLSYYAENTKLLKKLGFAFDIASGVISIAAGAI